MKLLRALRNELEKVGVDWEIVRKRRHYVIFVAGKRVGIFPGGTGRETGREFANVIANIKRAAREVKR